MHSAVQWRCIPVASTWTAASSKLQSRPLLTTISCCMMINRFSRRDVHPMGSRCFCLSIAERTGTANGMVTGTATGMATMGMATEVTSDGNGDGDGRWCWHCDGVSVKCESWCWASPLSEWCGKHNIGRYGSVLWWCNGTLTVLLCVTVYYGDITVYYCDSRQFPSRPKQWWSLAKWLPMMASPFSNMPYYA